MVQIYRSSRKPKKTHAGQNLTLTIDDMEHGGLGVCRSHQPVVFVEGALPGETVKVRVTDQKSRAWQAVATQVLQPSPERTVPFCPHIQTCGGCQNQHIGQSDLLRYKQRAVDALLRRLAGLENINWQPALHGEDRRYRRKARLAVDAQKKGQVRVGFRGKGSDQVITIRECQILTAPLQALLPDFLALIKGLRTVKHIGHIGLLDADNQTQVCLRITAGLHPQDRTQLSAFAVLHRCNLLLETSRGQFELLHGTEQQARYQLPGDISVEVAPNDFIQVNGPMNQSMIAQAIEWLGIEAGDQVLDFFCGVGNFSLPMARQGARVLGFEGMPEMVQRATENARSNGLGNVHFMAADLSDEHALKSCLSEGTEATQANKVLLDPARAGAQELMPFLHKLQPQKILYVSCNPATFARDAAPLVEKGWQLDRIALMDMFPNTAHTELMALFCNPSQVR
ncbi:23S rRNA (uracil(1939)-C(5))-methyltransferase RlmD [Bowmanella dokdonensis]|uniref:23S rRNA (Uracil(1939)-C(5))-methyltransferase RlmD n=1 Tax=Bowmanella dokdonensis TaxID=751969 RepID=A0A939DPR6_9ALTE|nr:23S rRNA (uracil(1939)-C(5))-methyltransferase RlmD [Bowmanella dokdonensis]MBN7826535.1 23S rRNA (uracil(1939)-C(5))-methyltransferase RlmD [Bowmanella dokdonensis]